MRVLELMPQQVVIVYFGGCVALWTGMLAFAWTPGAMTLPVFLTLHAAAV